MVRVFFNIRLDDAYLPEHTGQLVADEAEARDLARVIVRRLVADHGGEQRLLDAALVVTDAGGAVLFDLSFFEALYVPVAAPEPDGQTLRRAAAIRPPARLDRLRAALATLRKASLARGAAWRASLSTLVALLPLRRPAEPGGRYRLRLEPGT